MNIQYHDDNHRIDWDALRTELIEDDFHNGRTVKQLELSFRNSQVVAYASLDNRCIGTGRALSDGVGNAYVIDVWTHSSFRRQGIASELMSMILNRCQGQHIYLQTDDQVAFYEQLGFSKRPEGMETVQGLYLINESRD